MQADGPALCRLVTSSRAPSGVTLGLKGPVVTGQPWLAITLERGFYGGESLRRRRTPISGGRPRRQLLFGRVRCIPLPIGLTSRPVRCITEPVGLSWLQAMRGSLPDQGQGVLAPRRCRGRSSRPR